MPRPYFLTICDIYIDIDRYIDMYIVVEMISCIIVSSTCAKKLQLASTIEMKNAISQTASYVIKTLFAKKSCAVSNT